MDIGDKVKKGEVLATLFVPELVEDLGTKKATVKLDEERIDLAHKMVDVADADVKAAEANLDEATVDPGQISGRGRSLGLGGQAAHARGRAWRGRSPDPARVDQSVEVEHRRAGRGEGDHREGGGGTALQTGQLARPRSTSRSPRPTWRCP